MVIHDFRKVCIKCVSKTFLLRAKMTGIPITVSSVLQPFLSMTFSGVKDLSVSHKTPLASEMLILNNLNFKGSLSIMDKRCFKLSVSCSYVLSIGKSDSLLLFQLLPQFNDYVQPLSQFKM